MKIDLLKEKPSENPKDSQWVELVINFYDQNNVKIVEINPSRTLKIIHFLSIDQEEQLLTALWQNLDAFS